MCIMLNQTSFKQVDPIRRKFFKKYPNAEVTSKADPNKMKEMIRTLGFYNRRTATIIKFSKQWLGDWKNVIDLYGIGRYASDSWKIFQEYNFDIEVTDKELTRYLAWLKNEGITN